MPAQSLTRRVAKRLLSPLLNERTYGIIQARSVARDIRVGAFTEPELDIVPYAVHTGETAVDVGANLGLYLDSMSRAVGPAGKVYAFEPIPYTVNTLRRVVQRLRLENVEVIERGCGEAPGVVEFRVPIQSSGAPMTGQAHTAMRNDEHPGREHQVRWSRTTTVRAELVRLDDFLQPADSLSLIKCDIEGAELYALRGAASLIDRNRPTVICEINPWFLDGLGIPLPELVGFFTDRGYVLYRHDEVARQLIAISDLDKVIEDNYVFVHPRRLSRFAPLLAGGASSAHGCSRVGDIG